MSEEFSESEKKKEDWMNSKWRPAMGWMYMVVCIADFVIFPILWSVIQALGQGQVNIQWQPITLQGAGLFHVAMGAVLGLAAYGRTQEKLGGANNGGIQLPTNVGTTYVPPGVQNTVAVSNSHQSTLAATATYQPVYIKAAPVATGFGGKKAPIPEDDELL